MINYPAKRPDCPIRFWTSRIADSGRYITQTSRDIILRSANVLFIQLQIPLLEVFQRLRTLFINLMSRFDGLRYCCWQRFRTFSKTGHGNKCCGIGQFIYGIQQLIDSACLLGGVCKIFSKVRGFATSSATPDARLAAFVVVAIAFCIALDASSATSATLSVALTRALFATSEAAPAAFEDAELAFQQSHQPL